MMKLVCYKFDDSGNKVKLWEEESKNYISFTDGLFSFYSTEDSWSQYKWISPNKNCLYEVITL